MTKLTPQQRRVARLVAAGKTDKEIADELEIGKQGVWYHVRQIAQRLGITSGNTRVQIALKVPKAPEKPAA